MKIETANDTLWLREHGLTLDDIRGAGAGYGLDLDGPDTPLVFMVRTPAGSNAFSVHRHFKRREKYRIVGKSGYTLFGIERVWNRWLQGEPAVLVEGVGDQLACYKRGLAAAAMIGARPTRVQLALLGLACREVYLWSDGDETGIKVARAFAHGAYPFRFTSFAVEGHDPATFAVAGGLNLFFWRLVQQLAPQCVYQQYNPNGEFAVGIER